MRRVIVNSTPLLVLGNINRLDILQKMYGKIVIAKAVYREVTEKDDTANGFYISAALYNSVLSAAGENT